MAEDRQIAGTVDRLYRLDGGTAVAPDRSVYTPGERAGEPVTLPCNAYLIRRRDRWILWDTGIEDAVAAEPDGKVIAHGIRGFVDQGIARQLAGLGLAPADVGTVILSHGHFDHVGNAALFGHATWHLQSREHEAMFGPDFDRYGYSPDLYAGLRHARIAPLNGDADLFGDGSVRVLSSPGHTPGHCSILLRLAGVGAVLLTADVAHDRHNLDHRCVPTMNSDADATRASMERIVAMARREGAALWINHDASQALAIPLAPAFLA